MEEVDRGGAGREAVALALPLDLHLLGPVRGEVCDPPCLWIDASTCAIRHARGVSGQGKQKVLRALNIRGKPPCSLRYQN